MSSIKLKFDRESNFKALYNVLMYSGLEYENDDEKKYDRIKMASISYTEDGVLKANDSGFMYSFYDVYELIVTIQPLDMFFSKIKFEISNSVGEKKKIPVLFFGVRKINYFIYFDNEISGAEFESDDIQFFKEG